MVRSAKALDEAEPWTFGDALAALLGVIARNPVLVGGTTAFVVALSFVSANALWYQPHAHTGAFFATRALQQSDGPAPIEETTILIERPQPETTAEPQVQPGDPTVKEVQRTLSRLNFYDGEVDGLFGPNTRSAIEAYQSKMGLAVTGAVDGSLLDHLGTGSVAPAAVPLPSSRETAAPIEVSSRLPARDERVAAVQTGLREFGNEMIEVDGLMGSKTRAAILEFQSLFGLPETGLADEAVQAKMKEIGLIR
ncbi:MAG: peptidoglycan-binding protein [Rhizobiaceae bacterium]|nr:peptidoglycan-binding protein [Rhizobiaceae bacterium]